LFSCLSNNRQPTASSLIVCLIDDDWKLPSGCVNYVVVVQYCLVAALQGAALTAGGFIQPTYIADPSAATAAAAAAAATGTGLRYPSPLLSTVVATSNGLQYAMYVTSFSSLIVKLAI